MPDQAKQIAQLYSINSLGYDTAEGKEVLTFKEASLVLITGYTDWLGGSKYSHEFTFAVLIEGTDITQDDITETRFATEKRIYARSKDGHVSFHSNSR